MKKQLYARFLPGITRGTPIAEVSHELDQLEKHDIDRLPWPEFDYAPEVTFSVAHCDDCVLLKYYVSEEVVKASWFRPNDPVYTDSCVEFFIAFDDESNYYNVEFNVIGTCKLNYGLGRNDRMEIDPENISLIRYQVCLHNELHVKNKKAIHWEIAVVIPIEVFSQNTLLSLRGRKCRVNFYKCGDDLPKCHFLAWNNVKAPSPNFHVPESFGLMEFCRD
jgi:hypothetical protein